MQDQCSPPSNLEAWLAHMHCDGPIKSAEAPAAANPWTLLAGSSCSCTCAPDDIMPAAALYADCLTKELGSKMIDGQYGSSADLYSKTPVVGRACFRLVAFCNVRLASCRVEPLPTAIAPGTKPKSKVAVPTAAEGDERAQCHPGGTASSDMDLSNRGTLTARIAIHVRMYH